MEVSESGYYRYIKDLDKLRKDDILSAAVQEVLKEDPHNDNYGVPRMQIALFQKGYKVGTRKLTGIMRKLGVLHERKRRPKGLTKAITEIQERENLIKQDFSAAQPYQKLLTDISQIQCQDGKLYISPVLDCFNGEILALSVYGVPKRNADRSAWGNRATTGGNINRQKWESLVRRQAVDRG